MYECPCALLFHVICFSREVFGVSGAEPELWPVAAAPHGQRGHRSTHPCLWGHCLQELCQAELACGENYDTDNMKFDCLS